MRRVVVTGIGITSPVGATTSDSWENIKNSKSGIKQIPSDLFDTSDLATKIAGIIPKFDLEQYVSAKEARKMDKFIHYAIAATDQAIEDSGWKPQTAEDQYNSGVMIGSGIGGLNTIQENTLILNEKGPRRISPFFIPACLINLASGHTSIKLGY